MVIDKIINNNIVSAFDETGLEVVIMGRGIGFQMKRGQEVPVEKVEKIFRIKSQSIAGQLKELLAKMPLEQVQISNEIISYAKKTMKLKLNQSIYVTLTDHISFAISRCKKGIHLENALLWEIKRFYPQEFELGRYAVELVKKRLNVEMPEDEAGFIALHFVNAEYGTDIRDAVRFPNQVKEILGIVADELGIEMDEGSLHYERFLTHVKFLLQRIYRKELLEEEENEITEMMQRKYPREYSCSRKVADYIEKTADCKLSGEEVAIGLIASAAISAFVCGVTEPFEFAFMFLAPALYVVYALLYGIFTVITVALGFRAGFSFSAGLTDLIFSASLPAAAKTWLIIPLGIAAFIVFYVVFRFAIVKFDLKTPGREDDDDDETKVVLANDDFTTVAKIVLEGVGGKDNVESVDNCITRLRLVIKDYTKVDEKKIKSAGVAGVVRPSQKDVQVIIGTKVQFVADEFKKLCK